MTDPLFLLDPEHDDVPVNSDEIHEGWRITLPQRIRRHAVQSMRLRVGDPMTLSDGRGLRIRTLMADTERGQVEVLEFGRTPQPVTRLRLIQALAKNGRDEQAIDTATQIGVDAVLPWSANRSIAKWKPGRTDRKWRQVLESATEQSRRCWVPELGDCVSSSDVAAECRRACVHGDIVIVLHQDATSTWSQIEDEVARMGDRCLADGKPRTVSVVVGPEGGITDTEIDVFTKAGALCCVLGENILRASTAGPVALSLLSRALGRYS